MRSPRIPAITDAGYSVLFARLATKKAANELADESIAGIGDHGVAAISDPGFD